MNAMVIDAREMVVQNMHTVSGMMSGASSLVLLRQVEDTCEWLAVYPRMMRPIAQGGFQAAQAIRAREVRIGEYIDPDDTEIAQIAEAIAAFEDKLPMLVRKKGFIDQDRDLADHHKDQLHSSYDEAISAISDVIESAKELRSAIIAHDLAAESRDSTVFDTAESLIDSLHNGN